MPQLAALVDDFGTVGIDVSKWAARRGDISMLADDGGVALGRGSAANDYAFLSTGTGTDYDLTGGTAYVRVDEVVEGGTASCSFDLIRNGTTPGRWSFVVEGGLLFAQAQGAGNLARMRYHPADHQWWRFRHDAEAARIYFETSPDAVAWVVLDFIVVSAAAMQDLRVEFSAGYWGDAAGEGRLVLRYINTTAPIDRGPGYLTDDFDDLRRGTLPYDVSYGSWRVLDDGGNPAGASIVAATLGGNALALDAPTDQQVMVRTDMRTTITDLDFTCDLTFTGQARPGPLGHDVPRLVWRVQGDDGFATRYQLQIGPDHMLVQRVVDGASTVLRHLGIGTRLGVTYRFRIVHVGTTIVVHRDAGSAEPGRTSRMAEIARIEDTDASAITAPGHIGFLVFSAGARVDRLTALPGTPPPSPRTASPIRERDWGAFVAEGDYDAPPRSMLDDPPALDRMETALGRELEVASWFLDDNAALPVASAVALTGGGRRSNLVSWGPAGWRFADILTGAHDDYLIRFARGLAQMPSPTYVRILPEMNGSWAPWSVEFDPWANGVDPARSCQVESHAQFRAVWRYIVELMRANGATRERVEWVFCVNETDEPRYDMLEWYYPGDEYVDVLAFDAYNWGDGGIHNWRPHSEVFADPYGRLCGLHPTLPVWACETASKEPQEDDGRRGFTPVPGLSPIDPAHSKGRWVADLLAETGFARLTTVCWFSIDKERDWRFDSSETAERAFVDGFAASAGQG